MSVSYPSADDVARAIVAAARETGECPILCVEGGWGLRCRHYAAHALMRVYPDMLTSTLARVVGSPRSQHSFWTQSRCRVLRGEVKWWEPRIVDIAERAVRSGQPKPPFRLIEHIETRRSPASSFVDVTAALMGDPPPALSALDQKNGLPVEASAKTGQKSA